MSVPNAIGRATVRMICGAYDISWGGDYRVGAQRQSTDRTGCRLNVVERSGRSASAGTIRISGWISPVILMCCRVAESTDPTMSPMLLMCPKRPKHGLRRSLPLDLVPMFQRPLEAGCWWTLAWTGDLEAGDEVEGLRRTPTGSRRTLERAPLGGWNGPMSMRHRLRPVVAAEWTFASALYSARFVRLMRALDTMV